jgi:hypothetical protein
MVHCPPWGYGRSYARRVPAGRTRHGAAGLGRSVLARGPAPPRGRARAGRSAPALGAARHGAADAGRIRADAAGAARAGRGRGARVRSDQRGLAAGDPALVRPGPPDLGLQPVPVPGLPGVHPAVDCLKWTVVARSAGRPAAVGVRGHRRPDGGGLPLGAVRRPRQRVLAAPGHAEPVEPAGRREPGARRRPAVRQPARAGPQRAAGDGHRDPAVVAASESPPPSGTPTPTPTPTPTTTGPTGTPSPSTPPSPTPAPTAPPSTPNVPVPSQSPS